MNLYYQDGVYYATLRQNRGTGRDTTFSARTRAEVISLACASLAAARAL